VGRAHLGFALHAERGREHEKLTDWAWQMIHLLHRPSAQPGAEELIKTETKVVRTTAWFGGLPGVAWLEQDQPPQGSARRAP
jgi:hypothetical protein